MILESLKELAHREQLVEEPAFQSVPVRWIVDVDCSGRFGGLTDTAFTPAAEGKRKPKVQYQLRSIPRRSGRTSGDKAEFLVDKSDYVLGVLPEGIESEKSTLRQRLFLAELTKASTTPPLPALNAVLEFLQSDAERQRCTERLQQMPFASNDLFTFRVGDQMLDELPELRTWWTAQMAAANASQSGGQCLLCGQVKPLVDKHDSLKLPGAVTSGVALVSFNSDAFEKHGLSRNENAPVCRDCMVAYVNAIRRCLDSRYPDPSGSYFQQQSTRLSDNMAAIYWDDVSSELTGGLWALNSEDPGAVKAAFEAARKGLRPAPPKARFYCLLLSGAQGRASIRGMHISTVAEVVENLCGEQGYFACLEAAGYREKPAPMHVLTRSLGVQGKLDTLPPNLAGELYLSAVLGLELPHQFLAAAVTRIRAERQIPRPRAALLHLYFQRKKGTTPMSLDVDSTDAAYRYGRLLAVLERLQIRALGRTPNSTIVDRYYGAASTRPATAFPRLLALAQNHLRAVSSPGSFSRDIEQILSGLDGAKGFRPTLNLEQQGRFALGYFHQKGVWFKGASSQQQEPDAAEAAQEENEQ